MNTTTTKRRRKASLISSSPSTAMGLSARLNWALSWRKRASTTLTRRRNTKMPRTPRAKPLGKWQRPPFEEYLPVGPLTPGISRLLDDDGQPYEIDTYIDYFFVTPIGRKMRRVWMHEGVLYMEEYGLHNILADETTPNTISLPAFIWTIYHQQSLPPWFTGFSYKDNHPTNCTWPNPVEVID